jgi:hypothetical protein
MRLPRLKLVAGLDLARRSDHSALVRLDVEPGRLTVSAALRLPQAALRQQFALMAPYLAGLDLLVFDQSGLGDVAAELLPTTPRHIGVCLTGGLSATMWNGEMMTVAEHAPGCDLLRKELAQFVFKPGARGRLRLEAARGHDDLVSAAALAVLAVELAALGGARLSGATLSP